MIWVKFWFFLAIFTEKNPQTLWHWRACKTKVISLLSWQSWHKCCTVLWAELRLLADVVILTGACNIYVMVDETCGTDVFSKRIYLMEVVLSCVTKLRLSLVGMQVLCLVLTFFDLWYQIVLVCVVTFFQEEEVVLNSACLKRGILCADMLEEQLCSSTVSLSWGLVRNVWVKQVIQNLLIQYCGMGVNKWCLTFCWTFLDSVPRLVESCENVFIDSSFSLLEEIITNTSKFQNRNQ